MKTITHNSVSKKSLFQILFSALLIVILAFDVKQLIDKGISSDPIKAVTLTATILVVVFLISTGLRDIRYRISISWDAEILEIQEKKSRRTLKWSEVERIQEDHFEFHIISENHRFSIRKSDLDSDLSKFLKSKT